MKRLLAVVLATLVLMTPDIRAAYDSDTPVDFTLQQLRGEELSLKDLRGKWVVLNYLFIRSPTKQE